MDSDDESSPLAEGGVSFVKWVSIKLFHNTRRDILNAVEKSKSQGIPLFPPYDQVDLSKPIGYRGKVKLHGQNCAVTIQPSGMAVQSRNTFINSSPLGQLVFSQSTYWQSLYKPEESQKLTIFGEYCGPGVQKGVALAKLPSTIFCVFAIQMDNKLIYEPDEISTFLTQPTGSLPSRTHVIPWHTNRMDISFLDSDDIIEKSVADINKLVTEIDILDPWVQQNFNIKGPGEGLVLYPFFSEGTLLTPELFENFAFKAKGSSHTIIQTTEKRAVLANPEAVASVEAFVKMMVTEGRLQQGASEVGVDKKKVGVFIKWVSDDVQKEGKNEMQVSNLQWKDVQGQVGKVAREWYLKQFK